MNAAQPAVEAGGAHGGPAARVARHGNDALGSGLLYLTGLGSLVSVGTVVLALLVAWALAYVAGGSSTVVPHLFYVPIILAAVRFGWPGAMLSVLAATTLAGPALPLDVADRVAQAPSAWGLRGVMFLLVASLLAWLTQHNTQSLHRAVQDRRAARALRSALHDGEVVVYYQPIFHLETGRTSAVEALVRWRHPREGFLLPDRFIPQAERSGAIADLDRFVLREATRQVAAWSTPQQPVNASVNISAIHFTDPGLLEEVNAALAASGLPAERLRLEVTETAIVQDVCAAARQIEALRALGVKVAIDDFGAGQTSLSQLHRFTVDFVKLDRGFVTQITTDTRTARMVAGLVNLCTGIGAQVVAEGISDPEEYAQLKSMGCQYGQGFYLGRPAPVTETAALLVGGPGVERLD
jgi:EAL domain-containing protein (putative c-di-GMP-specific phosphodiesterase class I)